MVLLLRVFLIGLIVYLLVRPFLAYRRGTYEQDRVDYNAGRDKKISKDTGEYVEYEEIKD
ncbi:MAG TPA: hypothetical protein PLO24_00550 [Bacteroidales bacterium]|jgi:hypothetical protein|nr:hypothetical protein [Bacteroidales bacterium]HOS72202.1 hypothetical protein [Bacteroidales bacterium]HQH23805.1 hypothetical protein [Bacteroidales bacterium]HQJ81630.1 hypothetical protein [Bacteroidales bacterium]